MYSFQTCSLCLGMSSPLHIEADVVRRESDRGRESGRPKTLRYYFQICHSLACELKRGKIQTLFPLLLL